MAHDLEVMILMIPNTASDFPAEGCHLAFVQSGKWVGLVLRCALCPVQSSSSPAPGPSSSSAYAPGPSNSAAYAPGPANSGASNSSSNSGGGGGSFGPDLNSGNYQTVVVSAQYDPGTAALLGNVVGNLSDTIMAGTNLSVCFEAPIMASRSCHYELKQQFASALLTHLCASCQQCISFERS